MVGAHQNVTLPRPFRDGLPSVGLHLLLSTKFEVTISTHYEDMKGDTKCRNGVIWGSWGHSRSLEIASTDRAHTTSY